MWVKDMDDTSFGIGIQDRSSVQIALLLKKFATEDQEKPTISSNMRSHPGLLSTFHSLLCTLIVFLPTSVINMSLIPI